MVAVVAAVACVAVAVVVAAVAGVAAAVVVAADAGVAEAVVVVAAVVGTVLAVATTLFPAVGRRAPVFDRSRSARIRCKSCDKSLGMARCQSMTRPDRSTLLERRTASRRHPRNRSSDFDCHCH